MLGHTKKHPIKGHKMVKSNHKVIKKDYLTMKELDAIFDSRGGTKASRKLRGLRYRENLTQVQFAGMIGITQSNLSKMENAKRELGKNMAKKIADIFHIDYRLLL